MTKKEAKAHKVEWNKALAEGRIVRFGLTFKSFASAEEAKAYVVQVGNGAAVVGDQS